MKCVAAFLVAALACATAFDLTNLQGGLRGSKPTFVGVSPVPKLNVTQYLGRWYQMYTDVAENVTIYKGESLCVTADYGVYPNGTVSVNNNARLKTPTGALDNILGWANVENSSEPGALTVHLQGVPVAAPYTVGLLGPANFQGHMYDFAVVSDPLNLSLFVLARDPKEFNAKYDAFVTQWLTKQGFTNFLNKPTATYQADDCLYPSAEL